MSSGRVGEANGWTILSPTGPLQMPEADVDLAPQPGHVQLRMVENAGPVKMVWNQSCWSRRNKWSAFSHAKRFSGCSEIPGTRPELCHISARLGKRRLKIGDAILDHVHIRPVSGIGPDQSAPEAALPTSNVQQVPRKPRLVLGTDRHVGRSGGWARAKHKLQIHVPRFLGNCLCLTCIEHNLFHHPIWNEHIMAGNG